MDVIKTTGGPATEREAILHMLHCLGLRKAHLESETCQTRESMKLLQDRLAGLATKEGCDEE
jgi:hypothetical protein